MPAQSNVHDIVPAQLKRALQQIKRVEILSSRRVARRLPCVGSIGGAGEPQPAVELTIFLHEISEPSVRPIEHISRKCPTAIIWTVSEKQGRTYLALDWRIMEYNLYQLVILVSPEIQSVAQLSAVIEQTDSDTSDPNTFTWQIWPPFRLPR